MGVCQSMTLENGGCQQKAQVAPYIYAASYRIIRLLGGMQYRIHMNTKDSFYFIAKQTA